MNATTVRNALVAAVAMVLTVALAVAVRLNGAQVSLADLAAEATDWQVAQSNGAPTLLEFYADWCGTCRAMAPMLAEVKSEYRDRINFVMLNVDNPRWLPELNAFRVSGIPHFVFLDAQNQVVSQAVGEQPRAVMVARLEGLLTGQPLDTPLLIGKTSTLPAALPKPVQPRSHG